LSVRGFRAKAPVKTPDFSLLAVRSRSLFFCGLGDVGLDCFFFCRSSEFACEGVIWSDDHVGRSVECIRPGGKNLQLEGRAVLCATTHDLETHQSAFATADPVPLLLGGFWPIESGEIASQLICVGGDLQLPLTQGF